MLVDHAEEDPVSVGCHPTVSPDGGTSGQGGPDWRRHETRWPGSVAGRISFGQMPRADDFALSDSGTRCRACGRLLGGLDALAVD